MERKVRRFFFNPLKNEGILNYQSAFIQNRRIKIGNLRRCGAKPTPVIQYHVCERKSTAYENRECSHSIKDKKIAFGFGEKPN